MRINLNSKIKKNIYIVLIPMISLTFLFSLFSISGNAESDLDLINKYLPILYFEGEETCFPVDILYHIDNSYLYRFNNGDPEKIDETVTIEEISNYSSNNYMFLDNILGQPTDDEIIKDYQNKEKILGYKIYGRLTNEGTKTIIQYWFFYSFNKGELNQHEGDWEMVQVVFNGDNPKYVMYSQHLSGQKATWDQVEKQENHIKVYVARGSHANYLRSYSGKFGIASDIVGTNGKILYEEDYKIEILESQGWLDFAGRWGELSNREDEFRGRAGPNGPKYREYGEMWNSPITWGNSLPQIDNNILLFEWFLYYFVEIFIILTIISLAIMIFRIYRRKKKYGLGPRIISLLYMDGFDKKSFGNILCIFGIIIAVFGLFNVWYIVSTDVGIEDFQTHGLVDMIYIDGIEGIKINLLDPSSGPVQLGTFSIPFSLFIGIGIIFMIFATVGISSSKKLGRKYLSRGIKLLFPLIIILIVIISIGMIPLSGMVNMGADKIVEDITGTISGSPLGGYKRIPIRESNVTGNIDIHWGFGLGGQLLIIAGILLLIAGVIEISANISFFNEKQDGNIKVVKKDESKGRKNLPKKTESDNEINN